MTYEWNPLWHDVEDISDAAYTAALRRMIIASINWMDANPDRDPKWREPDKRAIARRAGVPDHMPLDKIAISGNWEDLFFPTNAAARFWFQAIAGACEAGGGPEKAANAWMFGKAVACGVLFKRDGWEAFDRFMSEPDDEAAH